MLGFWSPAPPQFPKHHQQLSPKSLHWTKNSPWKLLATQQQKWLYWKWASLNLTFEAKLSSKAIYILKLAIFGYYHDPVTHDHETGHKTLHFKVSIYKIEIRICNVLGWLWGAYKEIYISTSLEQYLTHSRWPIYKTYSCHFYILILIIIFYCHKILEVNRQIKNGSNKNHKTYKTGILQVKIL